MDEVAQSEADELQLGLGVRLDGLLAGEEVVELADAEEGLQRGVPSNSTQGGYM